MFRDAEQRRERRSRERAAACVQRGAVRRGLLLSITVLAACSIAAPAARAQATPAGGPSDLPSVSSVSSNPLYIPDLTGFLPQANDKKSLSSTLQILIMMTLLTVAPSILLMMTSFVRMLIVLVLLRQALGTQQLPPSQVLVGLALFMTILVMAPTWALVKQDAVTPYLNGEMEQLDALSVAGGHLRNYMFRQIEQSGNEQDVYMMYEYAAQRSVPEDELLVQDDVPMTALVPAFLLSELKTAFVLGFRIYLPFLVIDMVIATVLVSMGMMMLPPVLISLPFKLLLFVLADGWHLVGGSLMASVM